MRLTIASCLVTAALNVGVALAQDAEGRAAVEAANLTIPLSEVKDAVLATLEAETAGAALIEHEHNPDENIYLFRTAGAPRLFLIIGPEGDLRVRSREMAAEEGSLPADILPPLARDVLKSALAAEEGRIVEVTEDLENGVIVGYEAEIEFASGKTRWLAFASDGALLETQEESAWSVSGDGG